MKDKTFSRRMTIICSLGMIVTLLIAVAYAAAPPQYDDIQRSRIIMSLIRGEFDPSTGNLVLIGLPDANRWIQAFYDAYGPVTYPGGHPQAGEPVPYNDLTSTQKGRFYLRQMRQYHIEVRRGADVPIAIDAAKVVAEADVNTAAQIFPEIP